MSYEFNRNDVYGFARTISTDVKEKGNELFFKYCPYCHGGGKDKDTFSINLDNGTFKCFRSSCSKQGHFVELARDFGYNSSNMSDFIKSVYGCFTDGSPKSEEQDDFIDSEIPNELTEQQTK